MVKVWDLPTRVFHWVLVLLFAVLWISGTVGGVDVPLPGGKTLMNTDLHMVLGQVVLSLVLYRVLWGLFGSSTARFSSFVRGPGAVFAYLKAVRSGQHPLFAGHNPAGALMIIGMLTVLLLQAGTGLFANDDILSEGPLAAAVGKDLSDSLTGVHGLIADALIALVVIHVSAVVIYRLKGENLVKPMITGYKDRGSLPPGESAPRMVSPLLALVLLAVSVGVVFWGIPAVAAAFGG